MRIRQPCPHEPTCKDPSFHQVNNRALHAMKPPCQYKPFPALGTVTHKAVPSAAPRLGVPIAQLHSFPIAGRPAWGFWGSISGLSYTTEPTQSLLHHKNTAVIDCWLCTHTETGSRVPGKAAISHTLPGGSRGRIYTSILKLDVIINPSSM